MTTTNAEFQVKPGKALWAGVWLAQLLASPLAPAFAQRRPAEPEANPSFSSDVQGGPGGGPAGGPIGDEGPGAPPPDGPPGGPPPEGPGGPDEEPPEQGEVQIGATAAEPERPAPPVNPLDTRIVVRVKNAPLSTFLDTISAQAKVNFIITEGLEAKRITAFLQNVTVREALQILLEIKGLTYQRIGRSNTYVVSPRAKGVPNRITRIYALNYIELVPVDAGKRDFTPAGGTSGTGSASSAPTGGSDASGGGAGGGQSQQASGQGEQSQVVQPPTDKGIAIINVLRSVLSRQYGTIAVDARTNSLIITDIPETFPQVEQILAELDRKAPQVIIEAQIVEINSDRAQQIGLEWGGANGELASFTGPKRDSAFPLNAPRRPSDLKFFDPVTQILSSVQEGGGAAAATAAEDLFAATTKAGVLDLTQLTVVLRALVSRAEARFLGKPKILTLNNKQALIQVAQNQAVSVQTSVAGIGGTTGSSGGSGTSAERFSTGLTLRVIPQVNREGYITMFVEPSFTNVIESQISSQSQRIFDPATRAASTLVRVKNGQTLVLGGLLESRETKAVRKVPFLGYIPLIGWLFTSTSTQRTNTDLVIFITPTIVTD